MTSAVEIVPLAPHTWDRFEDLFGPTGVQGGCWCTWFRMTSAQYSATPPEARRAALRADVERERPLGLLACRGEETLGWVALAPRSDYPRLATSVVARLEAGSALPGRWSVVCFYIAADARGQGLTRRLLEAAIEYARAGGARVLEAYPVVAERRKAPLGLYHGLLSTFLDAGFTVVTRPTPNRALVRLAL